MTSVSADLFAPETHKDASISACGRHRLWLTRTWEPSNAKTMVMVGLNPSKADAKIDDPTIRRDIGFAKREDCGGLVKINLYTFRATDPEELFALDFLDMNHRDYRQVWKEQCGVDQRIVVACWGADERARGLAREFKIFAREAGHDLWCLGLSKNGSPRHPLYLRSDAPLERYAA